MESIRQVVRGRMDQVIKVSQIILEEASKLGGILSNGHFVISVKDVIWVIVMAHRVVITVESLTIWQRIFRIVITAISLVIR